MSEIVEIMARALLPHVSVLDTADECARAALSALEAEGWVVVPKVPTDAMLLAADETEVGNAIYLDRNRWIWSQMLSACPPSLIVGG